jgi:hypothetical protein
LNSSVAGNPAVVAPIRSEDFWVRYSNLLMGVWSNPALKEQLSSDPAQVLAYFDLAVPAGATVNIVTSVDSDNPGFQDQHEMWRASQCSPMPQAYTLYIPVQEPTDMNMFDAKDEALMADGETYCCCCCPCCSCF